MGLSEDRVRAETSRLKKNGISLEERKKLELICKSMADQLEKEKPKK